MYKRNEKGQFIKGNNPVTKFSKEYQPWRPTLHKNPRVLLSKMRKYRAIKRVAEELGVHRNTISFYVNKYKVKEIIKKEEEYDEQGV